MQHIGQDPLDDIQLEKFCQEYVKDFNKVRASREANLPEVHRKNKVIESDLVKNRVRFLLNQPKKVEGITVEFVLEGLKKIVNDCLYPTELSTVVEKTPEGYIYRDIYKKDYTAATRALELIGKHLGMWAKDNSAPLDHQGNLPRITIITSPPEVEGGLEKAASIRLSSPLNTKRSTT